MAFRFVAYSSGGETTVIQHKRKAANHHRHPTPINSHEPCIQGLENTLSDTPSESEDIQQKRPRKMPSSPLCDMPGCVGDLDRGHDLINHKPHGELRRFLLNGSVGSSSSIRSESTISTFSDYCFDTENSEAGLTAGSRLSSRSSSRSPDYSREAETPQGYISPMLNFFIQPSEIIEMIDHMPLSVSSRALILSDLAIPKSHVQSQTGHNNKMVSARWLGDDKPISRDICMEPEEEDHDGADQRTANIQTNARSPSLSPASFMGTEKPSTEDPGSENSDTVITAQAVSDECTPLQNLINEVLRPDMEVANILGRSLEGKLECAPISPNDHFDSGLSLLNLLELQDNTPIKDSGAFTTYASSSSNSASSSNPVGNHNTDGGANSTSNGQYSSYGDIPGNDGPPPPLDNNPGHPSKPPKSISRSNSSQIPVTSLFRCIHNALDSVTFCVNEKGKKYKTCAGPGWNSIQHYREHQKTHHSKEANPLQCNRCQQKFKNQKELKDHEKNVDCLVICPICSMEFDLKAERQSHQENTHLNEDEGSQLLEIDEPLEEKLKESLKSYSEYLKGKGKATTNPHMEQWIEANKERYMVGRPPKANAKLELGQWYTMFKVLSDSDVPTHPFYDFGILPSDLSAEKILLINKKLIAAKIKAHGSPPTELQEQQDWYQDILGDTLKLAAKSRLILGKEMTQPSAQSSTPASSTYIQDRATTRAHHTGFNMSRAVAESEGVQHYAASSSHPAHVARMHSNLPDMALASAHFVENEQAIAVGQTYPNNLSSSIQDPSSAIGENITDTEWYGPFHADVDHMGPSYSFGMPTDFSNFGQSGEYPPPENDFQAPWPAKDGR